MKAHGLRHMALTAAEAKSLRGYALLTLKPLLLLLNIGEERLGSADPVWARLQEKATAPRTGWGRLLSGLGERLSIGGRNSATRDDHLHCLIHGDVDGDDLLLGHQQEEPGGGDRCGGDQDRDGATGSTRNIKPPAAGNEAEAVDPLAGELHQGQ